MNWKKISSIYVATAVAIVNALLFFAIINIAASFFIYLHKSASEDNPVSEKYGVQRLKAVYPNLNGEQIQELLDETWKRPYRYEPFTQFAERSFHGRYVNVSPDGYRYGREQAVWPPNRNEINVFLFGGSTTFGYGVEDDETIGSYLQKNLREALNKKINVYNFGRGFYYSTQERILFEKLLSEGYVPDFAVFLDGLNDFYHYDGNPEFTDRLREFMNKSKPKVRWSSKLPILELFSLLDGGSGKGMVGDSGMVRYNDSSILGGVIARYSENKKIIETVATAYGVRPLFVWQPVPTYKYDTSYHLFAGADFGRHTFSRYGYAQMKTYLFEHPQDNDFLWAADIQEGLKEPLYVDQVHYSGKFSNRLSEVIAKYMKQLYF